MSPNAIGLAFVLLGIVLLLGKIARIRWKWTQKLFLPSSILAGFFGLLLGPQVLGAIASKLGTDMFAEGGLFGDTTLEVWGKLPGLLISVVFATLFLGQKLPKAKEVVNLAGPQLSVGVAFASGQYVVGLLLVVAVLVPVFGMSPFAGSLIEIGFEGGHGTAGGMQPVFEKFGWKEGYDLSVAVATVGLLSGIILGVAVINWAIRTGRTEVVTEVKERSLEEQRGLFRRDEQYVAAKMTARPSSIEPLSLHFAFVALAIGAGIVMLEILKWVEKLFHIEDVGLLSSIPLFPLAMIGGIIVQQLLKATNHEHLIDQNMMLRIQGFALDLLITSALATISIKAIANNFVPFLLLCIGGILLNMFILLWFVPRTIPEYWLERGIGDFGQSMGVTATGLILMRIVDPENDSPAFEAFGYKQMVFEPFFGGGLITAMSIPIISAWGPTPLLLIMLALFIFSLVTGIFYWGKGDRGRIRREPTPTGAQPASGDSASSPAAF